MTAGTTTSASQLKVCEWCDNQMPCHRQECHAKTQIKNDPISAMTDSSVPTKYTKADLSSFEKDMQAKAMESLQAGKDGVFLYGPQGTRKTTLGTAIFKERLLSAVTRNGLSSKWATAPALLADIRATYQSDSKKNEVAVVNELSKVKLLLIDDLGAEKITDWSVSAFYSILSSRINWEHFTIVTSNCSLKEIHNWEPRIASRLGSFHVIHMTGKDYRLQTTNRTAKTSVEPIKPIMSQKTETMVIP
jgi:DNA replication protein DnaC